MYRNFKMVPTKGTIIYDKKLEANENVKKMGKGRYVNIKFYRPK